MKTFAFALTFVLLSAATASAGDLAVTPATLEGMGLAGMQQLSDADGLAVRGKGPFENMFGGTIAILFENSLGSIGDSIGDLPGVDLGNVDVGDTIFGGFNLGDAFPFDSVFGDLGSTLSIPLSGL